MKILEGVLGQQNRRFLIHYQIPAGGNDPIAPITAHPTLYGVKLYYKVTS